MNKQAREDIETVARSMITASHYNQLDDSTFENYICGIISRVQEATRQEIFDALDLVFKLPGITVENAQMLYQSIRERRAKMTGSEIAELAAKYRYGDETDWSFNLNGFAEELEHRAKQAARKEVGKWLEDRPKVFTKGYGMASVFPYVDIEALLRGEMPRGER